MRNNFYASYGKRLFDVFLAVFGLVFLSPIFFAAACFIKLFDGGPVFFMQKRVGRDFRPFNLYKFRSMVQWAGKEGWTITTGDDPRITKTGRFLRKTKIDEFPQVFNVLKGDMSFVGPRPEVEEYVNIFRRDYEVILKVRPGITDYASILFSDEENLLKCYNNPYTGYIKEILPKKIVLYKKYLRETGFLTDIRLMCFTLLKIVK